MNRSSLIPWRKNRGDVSRSNELSNPFTALHREVNRMFDDFMRDFDVPAQMSSAWPSVEVNETDDKIRVIADVPGLEKDDVEVTLQDGMLTLRGEKKLERNGRRYSERWEGAFERAIDVGEDIDPDKVQASFKNGVLTVELSRKPEAQRQVKRIAVN